MDTREEQAQDRGKIQMDRAQGRGENLVYLCGEPLLALFHSIN